MKKPAAVVAVAVDDDDDDDDNNGQWRRGRKGRGGQRAIAPPLNFSPWEKFLLVGHFFQEYNILGRKSSIFMEI